ncbi:hypothetical protein QCA50_011822 [Cerrena zonata]|uniref:C3H1-type domain-containing protein n=1 Tax=Cerrena zonata TaxID=2478898 RepID=A0AAW0G5P9_9APHY
MTLKTRCYWYDDDGTPFLRNGGKSGCDRADCIFAHPWHKENWRTARKPDTYRCFWYDDDGNPYTHKNGAKGCERENCIFAHPFQGKLWAQSKKGDKLPQEFLLSPADAERIWGRTKRPWGKTKDNSGKEKRAEEKRSLKDRLSETFTDANIGARGREKKRARSKSRSPSRTQSERHSGARRRSHSPLPRSDIGRPSQDDLWKHKRRTTDGFHHNSHKHHSSRHSLRSSQSPPPRQRAETSTSENRHDHFPFHAGPSPQGKDTAREPPLGPRALREREQSPSKVTPASSANAIPIPMGAFMSRQTKSVPNMVPSAKMFAPPQPPITPATPKTVVTSSAGGTAGPNTLPDPQTTSTPVPDTPIMPSLEEIDNILSTLRQQNVLPATSAPSIPSSSAPMPEQKPISIHMPAPAVQIPLAIPVSNIFEHPSMVATSSVASSTADALHSPLREFVPQDADSMQDVNEGSTLSSRAQSPAPEPWSAASQPTDQRKTWAERIQLLAEVVSKQNFLTELDASLALQNHLAEFIKALDPSIDKGRFRVETISTNVRRIAVARDLEEAIEHIGDSQVWRLPALESNEETKVQRAERLRANMKSRVLLEEVKDLIGNVTTSVKELHRMLKKASAKKGVVVPSIHGLDDDIEMEVESDFSKNRVGPKSARGAMDDTNEMASALTSFEDSFSAIEDRLKEVEASLSQRQEEISEEIQTSLEAQFSDLRAAIEDPPASLSRAKMLSEINADRLNVVQTDMGKTGEEISELAQEVASVITQVHEVTRGNEKLQVDNQLLKDENERLRQELEEVKRTQAEGLARMLLDTEQLKSQFQTYIQEQTPRPKLPTTEDVFPLILPRVQEMLRPRIEMEHGSLKDQLASELKTYNEDLNKKVETLTGEVKFFEKWADQVKDEVDPVHMLQKLRANPAALVPSTPSTSENDNT